MGKWVNGGENLMTDLLIWRALMGFQCGSSVLSIKRDFD